MDSRYSSLKPLDQLVSKDYYKTTARTDFTSHSDVKGNKRF